MFQTEVLIPYSILEILQFKIPSILRVAVRLPSELRKHKVTRYHNAAQNTLIFTALVNLTLKYNSSDVTTLQTPSDPLCKTTPAA